MVINLCHLDPVVVVTFMVKTSRDKLLPQRYRDFPPGNVDYEYSPRSILPSVNHPAYNQSASYGIPGTSDGRSSSRSSCSDDFYQSGGYCRENRIGFGRNFNSPQFNRTPSASPKGRDFIQIDTRSFSR